MTESHVVTGAYNVIADVYDELMARDQSVRRVLWRHFARVFRAGDRVIDVGCGTGLDTLHLAARGVRVTAVDGSPGMIARLRAKLASTPFASLVETEIGDIVEVTAGLRGPFDGALSSFAALNTVDLARFSSILARLVRPGGRVVLHLLAPGRRREGRSCTVDIGGRPVIHECLQADETYRRFFAPHFTRRRAYALGFLTRDQIVGRVPAPVTDLLGRLESLVGGLGPLLDRGRFFVLDLQRHGP
jgi:SAM-dependent methyltransferase